MKKIILIFILFFEFKAQAQVVFCPPGAEWHYLQRTIGPSANIPWISVNEKVNYLRDTVVDAVTAKVLQHKFFLSDNSIPCKLTLVKQKGDTVFFRNQFTLHVWQVLYNYSATPGQSWYNSIVRTFNPPSGIISYTTTVDSISAVTENGSNLKVIYVKQYSSNSQYVWKSKITERYGSSIFLFNFSSRFDLGNADPYYNNWVEAFLCYSDSGFGTRQFGTKDCNYQNIVGLNDIDTDMEGITLYPNPVLDVLTVESGLEENYQLSILDIYGNELVSKNYFYSTKLDVSFLKSGIYILTIYESGKKIGSKKIIKE